MMPPQCDCTAYSLHALGPNYYMVIGPSGLYRRYCDSDCIVQQLTADRARIASEEVPHA
jgi:hypothetical protein